MPNKLTREKFINKANLVHGNIYNYSLVNYINSWTDIIIICPEHGNFEQRPDNHLYSKRGCPDCGKIKCGLSQRLDTDGFINKAQKIHKNIDGSFKYDYSLVKYIDYNTEVTINCNICKLPFSQKPDYHLSKCGCPVCGTTNISENKLFDFIKYNLKDIKIISQGKPEWLGRQSFDIYLPEYNIAIEYQGEQHFKPIVKFGGEESFNKTTKRDELKRNLCEVHDCKLFYFTYNKYSIPKNYRYQVYVDEDKLLNDLSILL